MFLDDTVRAERIPTTVELTSGGPYDDYPALAAAQAGGVWASWISYENERDAVWLARRGAAGGETPIRITPEDYPDNFRTAVAEDGDGRVVVIWSGKSPRGEWGIFARSLESGNLSAVATVSASQNVYHRAVADSNSKVHVVWQGFRYGVAKIKRPGNRGLRQGARSLAQARQAFLLETTHPIFHRPWGVAQQPGHLWAGHSLGHQQHAIMEAVVIAGILGASDLILQSKNDACSVSNAKWSHFPMRARSAYYAAISYDVMFRRRTERGKAERSWRLFITPEAGSAN